MTPLAIEFTGVAPEIPGKREKSIAKRAKMIPLAIEQQFLCAKKQRELLKCIAKSAKTCLLAIKWYWRELFMRRL